MSSDIIGIIGHINPPKIKELPKPSPRLTNRGPYKESPRKSSPPPRSARQKTNEPPSRISGRFILSHPLPARGKKRRSTRQRKHTRQRRKTRQRRSTRQRRKN